MTLLKINIAKDFSLTPGSRYIKEGDFSGELFRQNVLIPKVEDAIQKGQKLIVELDGTAGFGTSFLEESFGGLIRENKIKYAKLKDLFELISNEEPYLIEDIKKYLKEAYEESSSK